jgi:hypothetical protein
VNIGAILFVSTIVILASISIVVSYKKKQKTWNKIHSGTIIYYLYVNPYSGTGSTHKAEVVEVAENKIRLEHLGWITKKQFFNGKDNIEFLYL